MILVPIHPPYFQSHWVIVILGENGVDGINKILADSWPVFYPARTFYIAFSGPTVFLSSPYGDESA